MTVRRAVCLVALSFSAATALACASAPLRGACAPGRPLGSACGFENPEDLAWAPTQRVLVSGQMRFAGAGGRLLAFDPTSDEVTELWPEATTVASPVAARSAGRVGGEGAAGTARAGGGTGEQVGTPAEASAGAPPATGGGAAIGEPGCPEPDAAAFAPHGVFADAAGNLLVVNHGGRESIEIFTLTGEGAATRATWRGCVQMPEGTSANDVALGPDGAILASNFAPSLESTLAGINMLFGRPTGDIMIWQQGRGWQAVPGSAASGPNGVAFSPDGETIFFAETGGGRVVRMARDGSRRIDVEVEGMPDNLSWTSEGQLLLAGHESALGFVACRSAAACRSPWRVDEIDPATMKVREVFIHDGSVVGAVATAQAAGDRIYLGAVFGDRIGVLENTRD